MSGLIFRRRRARTQASGKYRGTTGGGQGKIDCRSFFNFTSPCRRIWGYARDNSPDPDAPQEIYPHLLIDNP